MGQTFAEKECSWGDFTVTKSNPGGFIVRFTVTDACNLLTSSKMIRSVLADAIDQWIALERADLDTNGDSDVKGSSTDKHASGDGFAEFTWNFASKYSYVTLSSLANISSAGTITVVKPYADVI